MTGAPIDPSLKSELVEALRSVGSAVIDHRTKKTVRRDGQALVEWKVDWSKPPISRSRQLMLDLIQDPIEAALLATIREIGLRAHKLGGVDFMNEVLENVAMPKLDDITTWGWDGIGEGSDKGVWLA